MMESEPWSHLFAFLSNHQANGRFRTSSTTALSMNWRKKRKTRFLSVRFKPSNLYSRKCNYLDILNLIENSVIASNETLIRAEKYFIEKFRMPRVYFVYVSAILALGLHRSHLLLHILFLAYRRYTYIYRVLLEIQNFCLCIHLD